jgi:hypothetical protein
MRACVQVCNCSSTCVASLIDAVICSCYVYAHTMPLQNRSVLQRALVVSAGVIANVMLTWLCLFASVSSNGAVRATYAPGVVLSSVTDARGPAAIAGLQVLYCIVHSVHACFSLHKQLCYQHILLGTRSMYQTMRIVLS